MVGEVLNDHSPPVPLEIGVQNVLSAAPVGSAKKRIRLFLDLAKRQLLMPNT